MIIVDHDLYDLFIIYNYIPTTINSTDGFLNSNNNPTHNLDVQHNLQYLTIPKY